jgi:hypothetical protein
MKPQFFPKDIVRLKGQADLWQVVCAVNGHALDVFNLNLPYRVRKTVPLTSVVHVGALGRTNNSF